MRGRIVKSRFTVIILGAWLAVGLSACAGQQSDDDDLEQSNDNNSGDLGNDDAAEGNGQENFVDNDEAKNPGNDSADVNSATGGDTGDSLDPTLDGSAGANAAAGGNAAGGNLAGANAAGGNLAGGANPAAGGNAVPANNVAAGGNAAPANAAAAPAGAGAPVSGGRVRYVKEGGVQVVSGPNGSAVMTLEQGEHPVTWEENGYLRITNGMYVPVDSMSDKGVARPASGHAWSSDGAAH